jgi:hypothetical protein
MQAHIIDHTDLGHCMRCSIATIFEMRRRSEEFVFKSMSETVSVIRTRAPGSRYGTPRLIASEPLRSSSGFLCPDLAPTAGRH